MSKRLIFLITQIALTIPITTTVHAGVNLTVADLETAMTDYCIPKGDTICNPHEIAKYNQKTKSCDCDDGYYWSISKRKCFKIECPSGYHVVTTTPNACPSGTHYQETTTCPSNSTAYGNY